MADTKISDLTAVTDVIATDEYVLARAGATNKITALDLVTALGTATDGWYVSFDTWTYATASTFTVTGDVTATYSKGTRLKFTQTTVKYAVVRSSTHAAGTTTVTIAVNDDYTIANAAITDPYYSYVVNPQGYPGWFNFSPTVTGYGSAPADICRYRIDGNTLAFYFDNFPGGTSNATTFTVSLPVVPATNIADKVWPFQFANSGATPANPGALVTGSTAIITLYRDWTGLGWTASGTKWARLAIAGIEF